MEPGVIAHSLSLIADRRQSIVHGQWSMVDISSVDGSIDGVDATRGVIGGLRPP